MAAMSIGKKTAELTEADLPAIKEVLLKMKANAKPVTDVVASQTALATGEVDILVGGGEWVTAGLAKENPALDFSIPKEGAVLWSQSLAMFKDTKNKDMALKFIQYILSPEGQARLATSSCYWGMPASKPRRRLTDEQKKILRFDEQPDFLKRAQAYPAPVGRTRQEDAGRLDRDAAGAVSASLEHRRIGWASVTPALLWTLVFFVVPFVAMAVLSLTRKGDGGLSLANYAQFFTNPSYWRALINSLEVTLIVTVDLRPARLSLRLDPGRHGAGALAAAGADAGHPAVLDLLCGALLFLAAGAGGEGRRQLRAGRTSGSCPNPCSSPTRAPPPSSASCISSSCC